MRKRAAALSRGPLPLRCLRFFHRNPVQPRVSTSGDEPSYLLTTQSVLPDRDLDLVNQDGTKSCECFVDHPGGLWQQSVLSVDGNLLSPHNPGLFVLLIPGFALGGLVEVQVQLLLIAAAAMALAFLLARLRRGLLVLRITRILPLVLSLRKDAAQGLTRDGLFAARKDWMVVTPGENMLLDRFSDCYNAYYPLVSPSEPRPEKFLPHR